MKVNALKTGVSILGVTAGLLVTFSSSTGVSHAAVEEDHVADTLFDVVSHGHPAPTTNGQISFSEALRRLQVCLMSPTSIERSGEHDWIGRGLNRSRGFMGAMISQLEHLTGSQIRSYQSFVEPYRGRAFGGLMNAGSSFFGKAGTGTVAVPHFEISYGRDSQRRSRLAQAETYSLVGWGLGEQASIPGGSFVFADRKPVPMVTFYLDVSYSTNVHGNISYSGTSYVYAVKVHSLPKGSPIKGFINAYSSASLPAPYSYDVRDLFTCLEDEFN